MARPHKTLPIPQVIPPAEGQAQSEPGVRSLVAPRPPSKRMARKPAFRTPVFLRSQNELGISGAMDHVGRTDLTPMVPLPVRASLAQEIGIYKVQLSRYLYLISRVTRWPGMPGTSYSTSHYPTFQGYPTAKVVSLINTSPSRRSLRPRPNMRRRTGYKNSPATTAAPSRPGYMNAPPRFKKAIPAPLNNYEPPVYGEN